MSKKFVSVFWGGKDNGGMFSNSTTPFSISGAAHALRIRHFRKNMFLGEIILAGQNEATKAVRARETQKWVESRDHQAGDIFQLIDVNQGLRYGMILCVGEKRGQYDS